MPPPPTGLHLNTAAPGLSFAAPTAVKLTGVGGGKAGLDDLAAQMAAVAAAAKTKVTGGKDGLITDPLAAAANTGLIGPGGLLGVELILQKARKLLKDKRYEEGRAAADEALAKEPQNPEAMYLRGFAFYHLKDDRETFRAVLPLRGHRLPGRLGDQVTDLRAAARERMLQPLLDAAMPRLQKDGPDREAAFRELDAAARLDPDADAYHYLLAAGYLEADRPDDALAAVERGLKECPGVGALADLRGRVKERLVMRHLLPARALYRKGKYAEARAVLARVPEADRGAPLWVAFDGFLGRLGGGLFGLFQKTPANTDPPGTPAQADGLYFFLAREELFLAKMMIAFGQPAGAVQLLTEAYKSAPRFRYLNFLLGLAIYNASTDRPPADPDALGTALGLALGHARVGATDPEVGMARDLVRAIEGILGAIAKSRAEAQPVNGLIKDFQAAMGLVGKGISSAKQLNKVDAALAAVQRKIGGVRAKVTSDAGRKVLDQLDQVCRDRLAELGKMKAMIASEELVAPHFTAFNTKMKALTSKPITTLSQLNAARTFFQNLRTAVVNDLPKVTDAKTADNLRKLRDAIDGALAQLRG